ncbi:MAG: hypothetical protein M0C28_13115 [Candidatus Moduliflexus flocculans]|nr:hypothetical protein [Candidatus Moduliflexus flocculans]
MLRVGRGVRGGVGRARRAAGGDAPRVPCGGEGRGRDAVHARALDGPPETAILWKNLILVGRYVSLRTLLRLLPLIVVFGVVARGQGGELRGGLCRRHVRCRWPPSPSCWGRR